MNKKVLSAILFSALFAGTGTFTSCIDTDEPAGIEELRGAKAELIRAKVAVEQAQASLLLAQAEVEKAKATKQLADAEISKALAAINQAKADSINVATEIERAGLEKIIAENKIHLDSMQVIGQIAMSKLNAALAQSQRSYEVMLAQIEIAKATASEKDYVTISELKSAVRRAQRRVDGATEGVADAQKDVDYWTAFDEAYKDLYKTRLEADVTEAEAGLADAKDALAMWENWLENAESADWIAEYESLQDTLAVIKKDTLDLVIEVTKIEESAEYKALEKAATETATAYVDSVYGYKYYDVYEGKLNEFAQTLTYNVKSGEVYSGAKWENSKAVDSLDAIKAGLSASVDLIKDQKTKDSLEVLTFTAYKKDLLDTLAANVDKFTTQDSTAVAAAVKAWETALAAYKAGEDFTIDPIKPKAKVLIDSIKSQTATYLKKKTAVEAFATALATKYAALPANQVSFNKIKLQKPTYPATGTKVDEGTITSFLASTDNKYHYMVYALEYFGLANNVVFDAGTGMLTFDLTTLGEDEKEYETFFTKEGEAATTSVNAGSVLGALKLKEAKTFAGNFKDNAQGVQVGTTLLGDLVVASAAAFGPSHLYLQGNHTANLTDKYYLTVKPTEEDIKYVFTKVITDQTKTTGISSTTINGVTTYTYNGIDYTNSLIGKYGLSFTASIDDYKKYAKNYKAYLTNLEGAVAYWESALAALDKKNDENILAAAAATEAFNAYKLANVQPLLDEIEILKKRAGSIDNVCVELLDAIEMYLPANRLIGTNPITVTNYEGLAAFLNARIKEAKASVTSAENTLADAELELALFEQDKYNPSADAQAALDEAIAELEKATAKLEEALANLAKGLEILAAVNEAE